LLSPGFKHSSSSRRRRNILVEDDILESWAMSGTENTGRRHKINNLMINLGCNMID